MQSQLQADTTLALENVVTAMKTMEQGSAMFKENVLFLKKKGFRIGICNSASYRLCMQMIQTAFPKRSYKTYLNRISALKKILHSKSNSIEHSKLCLTQDATANAKQDMEKTADLVLVSSESETDAGDSESDGNDKEDEKVT